MALALGPPTSRQGLRALRCSDNPEWRCCQKLIVTAAGSSGAERNRDQLYWESMDMVRRMVQRPAELIWPDQAVAAAELRVKWFGIEICATSRVMLAALPGCPETQR